MKKKYLSKTFTLLMTGMIITTGVSGCGQSSGAGSADQEQSAGRKQELTLWLPPMSSNGEETLDKEFWSSVLEPWEEENNTELTIEIIPWTNYEEKHLTGYSAGEGPDVTYMYSEMIGNFIDMGVIDPLDDYFTQEEKDNYIYYDLGVVQDRQYMIPLVVGSARVLFCNMEILNAAGVSEPPATWDELVEAATKVRENTSEDVMPFAQHWGESVCGALNSIYYPFLWEAGGDIYNEDETDLALLDNDAAVRAAQYLYDLMYVDKVMPEECLSLTETDAVNQFCEGNIAMMYFPTTFAQQFNDAEVNWDFSASLVDKTSAVWTATDGLVLNSACENKDLAVSLIKEITSTEVVTKFHSELYMLPPLTKDEEYQDDPRFAEVYANVENLHHLPRAAGAYKVMNTLYQNLQLLMMNELTAEEAIQNTVDYYNR